MNPSEDVDPGLRFLDAARDGDLGEVQRLLMAGVDPNTRDIMSGYTALYSAALRGDLAMARVLVEAGADPNENRNTVNESPLEQAASQGHTELVHLLKQYAGGG